LVFDSAKFPAIAMVKMSATRLKLLYSMIFGRRRLDPVRDISYWASVKNSCAGRAGVVVGNGPSLAGVDLDALDRFVTIASNRIYKAFDRTAWRPDFYTVADRLVWKDVKGSLHDYTSQVFTPAGFPRFPARVNIIQWRELGGSSEPSRFGLRFSDNAVNGLYTGGTVTFENIQIAVHLGLNPIFLIGCDHRYGEEHTSGKSRRVGSGEATDYFVPGYLSPGQKVNCASIEQMDIAYKAALEYSKRHGIRIINATEGSALHTFEKCSISDLLAWEVGHSGH
jgi:hypothetical protein